MDMPKNNAPSGFSSAMSAAMSAMDKGMKDAPMTGQPDHDFAAMMVPHHLGAVAMAQAEVTYGNDPAMKEIARNIVASQTDQVAAFRAFLRSGVAKFDFAALMKDFNAKQPRDKDGKWTSGAGASGASHGGHAPFKASPDLSKYKQDHPQVVAAKKWISNVEGIANDKTLSKTDKLAALDAVNLPKGGNTYQNAKIAAHAEALKHVLAQKGEENGTTQAISSHPGAPLDATSWKKIGGKLGTNNGGTFQDQDGKKWYVKIPSDPKHAQSEVLAGKLYDAMGVSNLGPRLVKTGDGLGVATRWRDDIKTVQAHGGVSGLTAAQKSAVQENFAAHALLANWDATGHGHDNQGFGAGATTATTLDGGGSLEYRAQGGKKGAAWNGNATEWDAMRDPKVNPHGAQAFGDMTAADLKASAQKLASLTDNEIAGIVAIHGYGSIDDRAKLASTLIQRRNAIMAKAAALSPKEDKPSTLAQAAKNADEKEGLSANAKAMLDYVDGGVAVNAMKLAQSVGKAGPAHQALADAAMDHLKTIMSPASFEAAKTAALAKTPEGKKAAKIRAADAFSASTGAATPAQKAFHDALSDLEESGGSAELVQNLKNYANGLGPFTDESAAKLAAGAVVNQAFVSKLGKAAKAAIQIKEEAAVNNVAEMAAAKVANAPTPKAVPASSVAPAIPAPLDPASITSPKNKNAALVGKAKFIDGVAENFLNGTTTHAQALSDLDEVKGTLGSANPYHKKVAAHADTIISAIKAHQEAGKGAAPAVQQTVAKPMTGEKTAEPMAPAKAPQKPAEPEAKYNGVTVPAGYKPADDVAVPGFDAAKLPAPPAYKASSKPHVNAANELAAQAIHTAAKGGKISDVDAVMVPMVDKETGKELPDVAASNHPSKAVGAYLANVKDEISRQADEAHAVANPPKQFTAKPGMTAQTLAQRIGSMQTADAAKKASAQKMHRAVKLASVGHGITAKDLGITSTKSYSAGTLKEAPLVSLASKTADTMKANDLHMYSAMKSYTPSGHDSQNGSFISGSPSKSALNMNASIHKYGQEIEKGTILSRNVNMSKVELAKYSAGDVMQDVAMMSTSINPSVFSSGKNVQFKFTAGDGVKGLYVGASNASSAGNEKEMILPANTRFVVHKVEKMPTTDADGFGGQGKTIIHATLLPTEAHHV